LEIVNFLKVVLIGAERKTMLENDIKTRSVCSLFC